MRKFFVAFMVLVFFGLSLEASTQESLSKKDLAFMFGAEKADVKVLSGEEMANTQGESFLGGLLVNLGISAGAWGICEIVSDDCSFEIDLPEIGF